MYVRAAVTSFLLATLAKTSKAQYDTGEVTTAIVDSTDAGATTTNLEVTFNHDDVTTATPDGKLSLSYYYAGCGNSINPSATPPGLDLEVLRDGFGTLSTTTPSGSNTCGIGNDQECAQASTFKYNMQALSIIGYTDIKTVVGDDSTVKFCVRLSLNNAADIEVGYKEADITITWKTIDGFSSAVTTTENGPDEEDVSIGDVSVVATLCSTESVPEAFPQGEGINICLYGTVDPGSVRIVSIDELRFWIDDNLGATQGVWDFGETTQLGVDGGVVQDLTSIVPDLSDTDAICNEDLTNYALTGIGCVVTTFLNQEFFFESTTTVSGDNSVSFVGEVTMQFANGNRRRVLLEDGELFPKNFGSTVATEVTNGDGGSDGGGGGGGGTCFSADSSVQVLGKGPVAMKDLVLGDAVATADGSFSPVYSFHHVDVTHEALFLKIAHSSGGTLEITPEHFVYTATNTAVRAADVNIGDALKGPKGSIVHVTEIDVVTKTGVYAPATMSGDLVVDGVAASSYASLFTMASAQLQDKVFHAVYAPHRLYCSHVAECTQETYYSPGGYNWLVYHVGMPLSKAVNNVGVTSIAPFVMASAWLLARQGAAAVSK